MTETRPDDCLEWETRLHSFLDGELDAAHVVEVEQHLATCPHCTAEMDRLLGTRRLVRQSGVKWQAPEAIRAQVLSAIALEEGRRQRATAPQTSGWQWVLQFARQWTFLPGLAALAASLVLFLSVPQQASLQDQILASHIRSMQADHLVDVETSDQHTVKPWFNGKLDFSPPVVDLAAQGFPLIGGRVDYVGGRAVAALIYRRHGHVINVFVWPGAPVSRSTSAHDGYNVETWSSGGLLFWAVSDVNAADLAAFRDGFAEQAGH
jgi:anti-sigma factor (TIGR02949 family)